MRRSWADYLGIPAIILRIFFILWMILGEFSLLIYAILWVVIPRQGDTGTFRTEDLGNPAAPDGAGSW